MSFLSDETEDGLAWIARCKLVLAVRPHDVGRERYCYQNKKKTNHHDGGERRRSRVRDENVDVRGSKREEVRKECRKCKEEKETAWFAREDPQE